MIFNYDYRRELDWDEVLAKMTCATISYNTLNVYNPETHELVEKKDAKIKRLKDKIVATEHAIESVKKTIKCHEDWIETNLSLIEKGKEDIKKLNKELKELE